MSVVDATMLKSPLPARALEGQVLVSIATGILCERERVSVEDSLARLELAAARAGVPVGELAALIIDLHGEDPA